jgi:hypothetical protein
MPPKRKLPDLDAKLKGKPNKVPPPEFSLMPMHTLTTFVGRRNSGKTYAALQLALMMKEEGAINRVFVISPTYHQNGFMTLLECEEGDVYTDSDNAFEHLVEIEGKIEEAAELWRKELEYTIIHGKWKKNKTVLTEPEKMRLDEEGYRQPQPDHKRPNCLLIIDDCSHSVMFSRSTANPLVHLCLRHRHLHGVGISIFFCLQTYKAFPRALRLNTCAYALFKTKDQAEIESFWEEMAGVVDKEDFSRMFEHATREDHGFLWADLCQRDDSKVFRIGFQGPFLNPHGGGDSEVPDQLSPGAAHRAA